MKLKFYLSCLAVGMFLVSCEKDIETNSQTSQNNIQQNFVEGEVLIKFKDGDKSTARTQSNALSLISGTIVETINTNAIKMVNAKRGGAVGQLVLVKSKLGTKRAIELLKNSPEIEYVEPNYIYQHFAISNDTYFTNKSLWGMYGNTSTPANQYGSQAAQAWSNGHTGSADVYIGIIDEGFMYTHEDLAANAGNSAREISDGIDNDGNGLVDDVYGWDFASNDKSVFDGLDDDHGTHVAGTIGAVGGNGKGVAGMAWNVKLLNAKFLGLNGGTSANAIKAIDYFTDLKINRGINIVATNNSWGGEGYSQSMYDAIQRANDAGILFIAAAGNATNNNDAAPFYPASYNNSNVIAVASITSTGGLSSFSNYGATRVHIGAPGSGIYSAVPKRVKGQIASGYASYNGTSMATPHVTGAVALYASTHPGASVSEIKNAILSTAIPTGSLAGKCITGARLNVSGF